MDARYPSTKGFLNALSSIKPPKAQDCLVHFNSEGLTLKWEHPSKAMQSGIFIGHAVRYNALNSSLMLCLLFDEKILRSFYLIFVISTYISAGRPAPSPTLQLFTAYNIQQETSFSLPFMILFNTLQVFAPGELGDLVLRYPGPESELILE